MKVNIVLLLIVGIVNVIAKPNSKQDNLSNNTEPPLSETSELEVRLEVEDTILNKSNPEPVTFDEGISQSDPEPLTLEVISKSDPEPVMVEVISKSDPEPVTFEVISKSDPEPVAVEVISKSDPELVTFEVISKSDSEPVTFEVISKSDSEPVTFEVISKSDPEPVAVEVISEEFLPEPNIEGDTTKYGDREVDIVIEESVDNTTPLEEVISDAQNEINIDDDDYLYPGDHLIDNILADRIKDEIMETAAGFAPPPFLRKRHKQPQRRRFAIRRQFQRYPYAPYRRLPFYNPYYRFYRPYSSLRFY